jgi:hypothetical protein
MAGIRKITANLKIMAQNCNYKPVTMSLNLEFCWQFTCMSPVCPLVDKCHHNQHLNPFAV